MRNWKDEIKIRMNLNGREWGINEMELDDLLREIDITVVIPLKAELFICLKNNGTFQGIEDSKFFNER
jgi:hypothetical protein